MIPRARLPALLALGLLAPAACERFPADPRGSLESALTRGTLRVGAIEHEPWVRVDGHGPRRRVTGREAELVRGFAHRLGVDVEWTTGGATLGQLERGELDVVVGGLAKDDPWTRRVGFTIPYGRSAERELVMAVPQGENAMLMALEAYLLDATGGPDGGEP
jgi:ABC-type amino acid transport substrate-binding protein